MFVLMPTKIVRQSRDSSSAEPTSQNPSESGEERAAHESQPAEPHNMNSESSKECGENVLADSSLPDLSIGTTQNEDSHRRSSKNSEPFEKWEREEMEELLSQLNGQLGICSDRLDVEVYSIKHSQSSIRITFWRAKILPIISCLMLIG